MGEVMDALEIKTPEQVWANIERSHDKASQLANYIANTVLSYDTSELDASDIEETLERLKTLHMHLKIMKAGYEEYLRMVEN